MSAAAGTVTCAGCQTPRPSAEVYERVPLSGEYFCTDTRACRHRVAYVGDPVGEFIASPPPAVPGAACGVCGAVNPPRGVYERSPRQYACLDGAGCAERAVASQYLTAHREDYPEVATTRLTATMHLARDAGGAGPVGAGGAPDAAALRQAEHDAAVALARAARG